MITTVQRNFLEPIAILLLFVMAIAFASVYDQDFSLDASSDTLLDQNDPQLRYYESSRDRFGGDEEFLVLTYSRLQGDLFTQEALLELARLQQKLEGIDGIADVYTILNAPLLKSPAVTLAELQQGFRTLKDADVDLALAKQELTSSPIFSDLLLAKHGEATALRITMKNDIALLNARKRRDDLARALDSGASNADALSRASEEYQLAKGRYLAARTQILADVADVQLAFSDQAILHLGGVPSIANDIVKYAERDLLIFSSAILGLVMLMLFLFFREIRFVAIPILASILSIFLTVGLLGFLHQNATIVSSNFVSILVITTISFCIHLIVKYRELLNQTPLAGQRELVLKSLSDKLAPCIYTALSTIAAFGSLLTSGILPVRDFGWIICLGIIVSFICAYGLFAGVMLLLPKGLAESRPTNRPILTVVFCKMSTLYSKHILVFALLLLAPVFLGISKVSLDNSFISYFKANTQVHQGLKYIDNNLGGTIPFDVILKFPAYEKASEDDFFDNGADEDFPEKYWFTAEKVALVAKLHDYIDGLPRTGKVLSLASIERVGRDFNDGKPLGSLQLVGALGALPAEVRVELIDPYASPVHGEMRISVRVKEYGVPFSKDEMLSQIRSYAEQDLGIKPEDIKLTGMMVMFNNMLKELFNSQQSSIGFVICMTFIMFLILLRSGLAALFGLIPNILAAGVIISFMGFVGIPLDLMTITVAALVIGIGVDDATHYLHRFRIEFAACGNVITAVQRCHASTGHALYFTSFTVIGGFSVLAFSNFVPTISFGLLASLAMILALIANLALLPALLVTFHPNREQ
ncbi:MAG: putative RND superfamily exporter protein [Bacteroidia bacterium]